MSEDRQGPRIPDQCEGAYSLAILYTLGYLSMLGTLMFFDIPTNNRELLMTLVGIMSAAQLGIIKFYYDGSQAQVKAQSANIVRAARNEGALQEIAKSAPAMAAAIPGAAPSGQIKADNVNVDAQTAVVNEKEKS